MDLVSSCKDKLTYFRIKELKDVLTQLGLAKQGKKQDLMDRILAVLSDEEVSRSHGWGKKNSIQKEGVAKIIDDTYRKMQLPGATDLASKSHSGSDLNLVKPKEEIDRHHPEEKARCPCGSQSISKSMIKCEDRRCQVWQHVDCVIIPEKAMEGVPPELPAHFYCDICRINRADPFWVTIGLPLLPLKLQSSGTAADGTTVVQNADKTFMLSRADREMLQRTEYDLQVWCILLNDKVPFRMQWPQFTELQVNGVPIRTTNRPGSQLLGINGRDDCPAITTCSREGINKICLSRRDARVFCFGIRIAKKRTFQQVMSLVPKELDGEPFEDALARVRRCTGGGGGTATENADSDSDIEVVADSITVNLRCPMSGSRMKVAGRFKPCAHMGCFDLEAFVELNQRSRKWQCPICLKNYSLENIIIDPYFNRITSLMRNCGEDVNEIDVRSDGSWRAKNEHIYRDLAQWHRPDGSLSPTDDAEVKVKPESEGLIQVKQEEASGGHASLKLGIKKNRNGVWEVNKPDNIHHPPSGFYALERLENSATGSCREGEDQSVNQDGGHYDLSNGHELDSISLNFDPAFNIEAPVPLPAPLIEADIIVLSDSDDDNVTFVSPGSIFGANTSGDAGIPYPAPHPGVTEGTIVNSCLGLFENDDDNFEMPLWPIQSAPQAGSSFELFGAADNAEASDPPIIDGFGLGSSSQARDPSTCGINNEFSENLVDNPLAFSGDDPSLQLFLPNHRSCGGPLPNDSGVRPEIPNRDRSDDWISLTLAAGGGGFSAAGPLQTNEMNSRQQSTQNEMADTASLLLSINEERSLKRPTPTQNGVGVGGPFSHPRQPRSVRRRMYLSIDTESD